jgi:2-oxoglutarate dehydrogenase E2 component (dihydrolipoamide succinyltransferase)
MATDVVMPQMGESIFEGTITKWLKKPGEQVQRDEPLFEISTDKVDAEIPSPVAGVLTEIKFLEGSTVQINTVVAVIGEAGSAVKAAPAAAPASKAEAQTQARTAAPAAAAAKTQAKPAPVDQSPTSPSAYESGVKETKPTMQDPKPSAGGTNVVMPQMGESIFEGTITKWLKKVGDQVQRDEPLFEISTDKVDAEIPSPTSGVLTEIKFPEGSTVQINTVVAVIGGSTAGTPAPAAPAFDAHPATSDAAPTAAHGEEVEVDTQEPTSAAAQSSVVAAGHEQVQTLSAVGVGDRIRSSPLVRRIAKDNNLDLSRIQGTGSSGRISKADVIGYLSQHGAGAPAAVAAPAPARPQVQPQPAPAAAPAPRPAAAAAAAPLPPPTPGELVPMSKMRAIIAKRMVESKQTSAHVHTVFKVDMTRIVRLREKEKSKYEQRNGVKLTFMPFIARAAISALRKHPGLNTSVEGDAIRYHKNINLGIAVALDWGLIVPVIKQAEERSFLGVARAIVDIAERARSKKLKPDEVADGTFTLTNSGIFGEQFGTPVIAQPQTAILGIGGLFKEPLVVTDKDGTDSIAIRSIVRLSLGFDHRIIDGADAGKFMSEVKNTLENWSEDIG